MDFYRVAAPFYDADFEARHYTADIPFYRALAVESRGPVLEMGCGTGRILLPIARAGVEICGLDSSAEMLGRLREKLRGEPAAVRRRVKLVEGDARSARLGRKFALVTAPFRVVQHLLERADQRAWLRNVARHLRRSGALCFDVFQPDYSIIAAPSEPRVEVDRVDPATGRRIRLTSQTEQHPERQQFALRFQWQVTDAAGASVSDSSAQTVIRWFTRGELENLLELEGFRITDYWGSFDRRPHGAGSPHQIIRARLA